MAKKNKVKFSFLNRFHDEVLKVATVTKKREVQLRRTELKAILETVFEEGAKRAASGERVRFPVVGALVRKEVKARKAGKGKNPFTGEIIQLKARPASHKPRWSVPKSLKEIFSAKKNW